jgi:CheY-like chemotaxis protein
MANSAMTPAACLSVLVAEDNLLNQKVIMRLVRSLGCDVEAVANGLEVLVACARRRFDVVLMDVRMPEMNGLEAARRLRQELPTEQQPHIYAMTAGVTAADRQACFDAGMNGFVAKPVVREELEKLFAGLPPREAMP